MSLKGQTVFIPGGCGTVGIGLTRVFLKNGAKVAVSSRTQERLNDFKKLMDLEVQSNLILIQADASTETGAKTILDTLVKQDGVQHVVALMGGWWQNGSLSKQSLEEFEKEMRDRVTSHFICAKTFLPYMADIDGATYTITSGSATCDDWDLPDSSMIIVAGGAVYGVCQALQSEFREAKCAVNEVRIGLFIQPKVTSFKRGNNANEMTDIWSLACTLVEIFNELPVWNTSDEPVMYIMNKMKLQAKPDGLEVLAALADTYHENVESKIYNLLNKGLSYNDCERPRAIQIVNCFHGFVGVR